MESRCADTQAEKGSRWAATEGLPFPLGVSWIAEEAAFNFALYSKHAERVTLLLYAESDVVTPMSTFVFDHLKNKSGRIWHCRIPRAEVPDAAYYAYSVDGPESRSALEYHAFDPAKILLDPYAKSVLFPPAFDRSVALHAGSNAGRAPLGVLTADAEPFDWRGDECPRHEADAVIYELHVKGFTRNPNSGVPSQARGTYAGVIAKIPYLKELGVTVVELMPVLQYDPAERNYWGYNPLNFFAPHNGYLSTDDVASQHNEFREMVREMHSAGIEVVIDVVYNHTAEGDHRGPVYSFKGIDNNTYYLMVDRPEAPYANFSGTGNTLNCMNRYVRKIIMDSVRHWAHEMRVDGFRFDLASIFARSTDGSIDATEAPVLSDMASDPDLAHLRLIAEPWDAGGAYQLGSAFPGITTCQWNARFRDDVRRFVRGDRGMVGPLMRRIYGSDDLFPDDLTSAYHPHQSINYVTAHDGFTLYDLVAYDSKCNWANGHGNTDGMEQNYSWNCGWEGHEAVPADVRALRKRQIRNFCCLLFLANGTPMFRSGDEFMQTQGGNNNPYNQDNETSWLDWSRLEANGDVFRFFKLMIAFRKRHPSLARSRFWREDVRWYGVGPQTDLGDESHSLAFFLCGAAEGDDDLYVMINAYWQPLLFEIQEQEPGRWRRVIDTSQDAPFDFLEHGAADELASSRYELGARSVVVLVRCRPTHPT